MRSGTWEHFEHDADIGLSVMAPTRARMFEVMGEALTALVTEPGRVRLSQQIEILCEAPDDSLLLVDWLNALIYEMATRNMIFGDWHVDLYGQKLRAQVVGESIDRDRHRPVVEVKGATYTALSAGRDEAGNWLGQCVVDV